MAFLQFHFFRILTHCAWYQQYDDDDLCVVEIWLCLHRFRLSVFRNPHVSNLESISEKTSLSLRNGILPENKIKKYSLITYLFISYRWKSRVIPNMYVIYIFFYFINRQIHFQCFFEEGTSQDHIEHYILFIHSLEK